MSDIFIGRRCARDRFVKQLRQRIHNQRMTGEWLAFGRRRDFLISQQLCDSQSRPPATMFIAAAQFGDQLLPVTF